MTVDFVPAPGLMIMMPWGHPEGCASFRSLSAWPLAHGAWSRGSPWVSWWSECDLSSVTAFPPRLAPCPMLALCYGAGEDYVAMVSRIVNAVALLAKKCLYPGDFRVGFVHVGLSSSVILA